MRMKTYQFPFCFKDGKHLALHGRGSRTRFETRDGFIHDMSKPFGKFFERDVGAFEAAGQGQSVIKQPRERAHPCT